MGSYATTTSISEMLPGFLAGNTTTSDTFGRQFWSRKIDDAEARINATIASRYGMPFSTIPPFLRVLSGQIATFYAIRDGFTVDGLSKNQYLEEYKDAISSLDKIRKGEMSLTYTDGSLVAVNTSGRFKSSTENQNQIFQLDDPVDWDRDDDEITETSDARD